MKLAVRLAIVVIAVTGCAPRVRPADRPPLAERLSSIDRLLEAGCYDCLIEALTQARQLAASSSDAQTTSRVRDAVGLLAIRERDLGLVDQHYLDQARDAFAGRDDAFIVDVIATLPRRYAGAGRAADEAWIDALRVVSRNRDTWRARVAVIAGPSLLAAATAISFDCVHAAGRSGPDVDRLLEANGPWKDTPLLRFTSATCVSFEADPVARLLEADPRFVEINYFLGIAATLRGNLDEADRRFKAAFDWHHDWPAATIAVANLAMTAEDFDRAVDFYGRTLALVPGNPDAMLGRVRALSFGGKYTEAIAAADPLLANRKWYVGDALYWRAWNEAQIDRNDAAWDDVHEAAKLVVNADVPKLTGLLAVRRRDFTTARTEFEAAHGRNPTDCETTALLGGTGLELRQWQPAMPILADAVTCLDAHDRDLRAEIERLRAAGGRDRIIAHREQSIEAARQQRAQAYFNLAVAAFNLGDREHAREYAERVQNDEHFGERARQLIERVRR